MHFRIGERFGVIARVGDRGIVSQKPISGEASITPPEIRRVSLTPALLATRPQPQLPSATPPAIDAWKAASARPATQRGADSCTPMLNSAIASIQTAPATTSASAVSTGQRLSAVTMMATPMMKRADAHRELGFELPPHGRDVQRADHRAEAERAEHDAVEARAAAEQVAREQRHQRRRGAADDAEQQRARQHRAQVWRMDDVAHAGDDGAGQPLRRQAAGSILRFHSSSTTISGM